MLGFLQIRDMYTSLNTELDKGEKAFKRIKEQISAFSRRHGNDVYVLSLTLLLHSSILNSAQ